MSTYPPPPPASPLSQPARPAVVEVVARRGGVSQAIFFVLTLGLLAVVFVVGISLGAFATLLGSPDDGIVLETTYRHGGSDRVALIDLQGPIGEQLSEDVRLSVDHVLNNPGKFSAVVLRVDSPGGAVSPSDRIWRNVQRLKQGNIPVVASYGGVAASGGVYASCDADEIVCEPTAITGSVGVIASVLTFGDLMSKVGVEPVTLVATGSPRKDDANDVFRKWTLSDRTVVQGLIDNAYELFVARVVAGRTGKASDLETLKGVLDGRVLTADDAKAIGLVDSIGYLDDAIAAAEHRASVTAGTSEVVRLVHPRPFWGDSVFGAQGALKGIANGEASRAAGNLDGNAVRDLLNDLARPRVEYVFR